MVFRKHLLRSAIDGVGLCLGLLVGAFVLVAWMLAQGPLPLPILIARVETELSAAARRADLADRARVDAVTLEWHGLEDGLEVAVRGVHLLAVDGSEKARIGRVDIRPDLLALTGGSFLLRRLALIGPEIRLVRHADGRFSLGMPAWATGPGTGTGADTRARESAATASAGAPPSPPGTDPRAPAAAVADLLETWGLLADLGVSLRDATLIVEDRTTRRGGLVRPWRLGVSNLAFLRRDGTLLMEASAAVPLHDVSQGEAPTAPSLDLALRSDTTAGPGTGTGNTVVSAMVVLKGINPGRDLARPLGLPALEGWRQTLRGALTLDLDPGALVAGDLAGGLTYANLSLTGGPGAVAVRDPVAHTWAPRRLSLDLTAEQHPEQGLEIALDGLDVDLPGASLRLVGKLRQAADGALSGALDLWLSGGLDVPTVVQHWPASLADGARNWIAENLSDGVVGETTLSLALGGAGWDAVEILDLSGASPVSGMTVDYLRGLPPATEASGTVRYGRNAVTIDLDGGGVGNLRVREGSIAFTDLDTGTELADMVFRIDGPLSDALALIDHDPLGYASRVGIDPGQTRGQVDVTLGLAFPLLKDLSLEALDVSVSAEATGAGVPAVVLGQDLSEGTVSLTLDGAGMDVTGAARVGGVPVSLDWRENFTTGAEFDRRYRVSGRMDNAARARFRLSGAPFQPPWLDGPVDATLTYTETRGRPGALRADVDLSPATLALAALDWRKPAGVPGRAAVTGRFSDEAMTVDFDVTTAAAGTARGQARLTGGGDLRGVTLESLRLGPDTDIRVSLETPASATASEVYRIDLSGPALDVRALLDGKDGNGDATGGAAADSGASLDAPLPAAVAENSATLDLRLDVGRLWLTDTIALEPVVLEASRDGDGHWRRLRLDGRIGADGPEVSARLEPDGAQRRFGVRAGDAGAVADALGVTDQMRGGTLSLTGTLAPDDSARGVLGITDFRLDDAPVLARILAVAALTGILDELRGSGLSISRLHAPFRFDGATVTLEQARANGSALGLTANGLINLDRDRLDLSGVVVPIYALNNVLSHIPLVGDLLVGETGGGLFAVSYRARGPMEDPSVSVNPLSVLTPGFLRGLFGLLPGDDPVTAADMPDPFIPAQP